MKLEDILAFIENLNLPKSTLFGRFIVLKYIITIFFHKTNMGLIKEFAIIFEENIKYSIVVNTTVLQKQMFFFSIFNQIPKFSITFIPLSIPLCISPRVS